MHKDKNVILEWYLENLILPSSPEIPLWNSENKIFLKQNRWNYIDACMIKALIDLFNINGDNRLLDFCIKFTDYFIDDYGNIKSLEPLDYNLDSFNGGKNLISLYEITKIERYKLAYEKLISLLMNQPRISSGNFWHKKIYPHQVWLDGVYMVLPFMTKYAMIKNDNSIINDVLHQLNFVNQHMRDKKTGLYFHGYDDKKICIWADKTSGLSKECWLRANGWLCAALADICEISVDGTLFELSKMMLKELLYSLSKFVTSDGLLMQLPNRTEIPENYEETSGTSLVAYSALKMYRITSEYEFFELGKKLFFGVTEKYLCHCNSMYVLNNICLVAGLGGCAKRNGSIEYYLSEPIVSNDAKGLSPLLMSYTELSKNMTNLW